MADPIEVNYVPDGADWTITIKGRGQTITDHAAGLIAARDRADQLVEELTKEESSHRTVVHLLDGDAVEFTTAYLTARMARTEPAEEAPPAADGQPAAEAVPGAAPTPRDETEAEQAPATEQKEQSAASG